MRKSDICVHPVCDNERDKKMVIIQLYVTNHLSQEIVGKNPRDNFARGEYTLLQIDWPP